MMQDNHLDLIPLPNLLAEVQEVYWSAQPIFANKRPSFVVHYK